MPISPPSIFLIWLRTRIIGNRLNRHAEIWTFWYWLIFLVFVYRAFFLWSTTFFIWLFLHLQGRNATYLMDPRQKYAQWLRIALSEGLTRLGAFLAWRRKHSRLPKPRASLKIIRWTESKKNRLCQWVKQRSQNRVELYWTFLAVRCYSCEFCIFQNMHLSLLTLIVLMWRIGWAHNNARK